jgi:MFS family permease
MNAARPGLPSGPARGYAYYALGLLALINLLSYINRNVIFALVAPIERDLGLNDTHLGWIASAYVLLFSVAALPFGVLSDLRSRRAVIAGGIAVWSAFTSLGGLVQGFWALFVCRAMVGIGGAAFGAAAASLVADYFPGKGRAFAMGVLAAGIAVGGVVGIGLGGQLEAVYGWRVALMAVGAPGFLCAALAARLRDPVRPPPELTIREYLIEFEVTVSSLMARCVPLILGICVGASAAYMLDRRYGASSSKDTATFAVAVGLGLALNIHSWVKKARLDDGAPVPADPVSGVLYDMLHAVKTVLRTPTLKYVFVGGALISFGMNGLVGWAPTFLSRELGLTVAQGTLLLGKWGLIAGTAGTLSGGIMADWFRRYTERSRVLTASIGFLIGGPLALWLLTIRDLSLFVPVFCAAFFFLTLYSGPIAAVVFDVVPSRISATVVGAYLLFIHLAGDAIAYPLVGTLSDHFGIHRAALILPAVALLGGLVVLLASRTVEGDMRRASVGWEVSREWSAVRRAD